VKWSVRRPRVWGDVIGYAGERVISLGITAVVGVLVARHLGPSRLGLLNYATSVFALFAPMVALGLPQVLVRDFSTNEDWRPLLSSAVVVQLPLALVAIAAGIGILLGTRSGSPDAVTLALVLLPLPLLSLHQTLRSYLESRHAVRRVLVVGVVSALFASGVKLLALGLDAPLWLFGLAATIGTAVLVVGYWLGLPRRSLRGVFWQDFDRDTASRVLQEAWPLLISVIAVTIYMKSDVLMLGALSGDRETGIYSAAARLSEVWYVFPTAAMAAVRPRLSRIYATGETRRYDQQTQRFLSALVLVALPIVLLVLTAGPLIIRLLYGQAFADAVPVLRVHVLAAPFVFIGVGANQWFIDRGLGRALMLRSLLGAVVNVGLNIVLIPRAGALGASVATLVAYATGGFLANAVTAEARALFVLQAKSLTLRWPGGWRALSHPRDES
jgi:PST family polysaccharide transporter